MWLELTCLPGTGRALFHYDDSCLRAPDHHRVRPLKRVVDKVGPGHTVPGRQRDLDGGRISRLWVLALVHAHHRLSQSRHGDLPLSRAVVPSTHPGCGGCHRAAHDCCSIHAL